MIRTISTTHKGDTLSLDLKSEDQPIVVIRVSGLGGEKGAINTLPMVGNGSRLGGGTKTQRNITLTLGIQGTGPVEEAARLSLYKYFPVAEELTFGVITDTREMEIDAIVETGEFSMFSKIENKTISLICPFPWFRGVEEQVLTFSGTVPMFEFPFSNESLSEPLIEFGEELSYVYRDLIYDGEVASGAIFKLHMTNPAEQIRIYNPAYEEEMHIDTDRLAPLLGTGLLAGDDIHIDTRPGKKRIYLERLGVETNLMVCLGRNPTWISLYPGVNALAYSAEVGEDNVEMEVRWHNLYRGV